MLNRLLASVDNPWVPGRDEKERIELDFSGSKFSISLPHNSVPDMSERMRGTQFNIFDESAYDRVTKEDPPRFLEHERGRFPYLLVLKRTFAFLGKPWRKSELGTLSSVIHVVETESMPDSMSCFVPGHCEQAIMRYLHYMYGPGSLAVGSQTKRLAPVNWSVEHISGVDWCYFEAHRDFRRYIDTPTKDLTGSFRACFATPLDKKHLLMIIFDLMNHDSSDDVSPSMLSLMREVSATMSLEYSPSAKEQLEEARQKKPSVVGKSQRQPENWLYPRMKRGDSELNEPRLVILEEGSSPPEWNP
ncbi:hypothetical protein ACFL2V_14850 [Pseudomonadota bacterium]